MWYLLKRGLSMLVILMILSVALFGLLSSMPGNPIDLLITSNPNVKPEDVIRLKRLRGLDKPWYVQYVRWIFGYREPARPPVIVDIDQRAIRRTAPHRVEIDLSNFLIDPNFMPSATELSSWITEIWPQWSTSRAAPTIEKGLIDGDIATILLAVARESVDKQNILVQKIERASTRDLNVKGLFGATVHGHTLVSDHDEEAYLWFLVTNTYGQEKLGRVSISSGNNHAHIMSAIPSQIVESEEQPFSLDLKKFVVDKTRDVSFALISDSVGTMTKDGIYSHQFPHGGQTAIFVEATAHDEREIFAFDVEHGALGHNQKFNRGFLFFFIGDRSALGFSQTYKRPVYDLLFGTGPICGDGKVDIGETCDDYNRLANDGCDPDCFKESDSYFTRADASFSVLIVRTGRIGNTVQLMLPALLLSLLIAIPLGVYSAYRQYSILDYVINFLAFLGISLPVFWFGIMMIYVFAEGLQWFPAGGVQTPSIYGNGSFMILVDRLKHAILPTVVLSIFYVGRWLRYMRASMLEVLPKDYIRTARAKGLSERAVILKHAFRNALIPVVTVLAMSIPSLFGGAVLTETVFSWPGVGRLQYEAVMNSDYYVAIIVFLVSAVLVMLGNFFADVIYVLVDPRIRKL